jgi:long-subunit acyl-CoA synthetase (AMP-forming)
VVISRLDHIVSTLKATTNCTYLALVLCLLAGYVGFPLPGVQCRLVDDHEQAIETASTPGELRIKGPQVFSQYLNRPDATKETFDSEDWFKTGDVAEVSQDGYYKILGRNSADIIKVWRLYVH